MVSSLHILVHIISSIHCSKSKVGHDILVTVIIKSLVTETVRH